LTTREERQKHFVKKTTLKNIKTSDDYHGERILILNENDSRAISSSRFMVNKKRHLRITIYLFQNAFIGNVAIYIYGGSDGSV